MRIHCFQHVDFEDLGSIKEWCLSNKHTITYTRFYEGNAIPGTDNYDCLIIMGGPMGVYDDIKYPWIQEEKEAIKQAIEKNKIVIGICLGAQLIASVLGAKIYKNTEKEIGWFDVSLTEEGKENGLFYDFESVFKVFHWHGDTFDLPEGAKHIAFSGACKNQAFLFKDNVLGLQFHFEVTALSLSEMIKNGNHELDEKGTFIQNEEEILSRQTCIPMNNEKMAMLLGRLLQ